MRVRIPGVLVVVAIAVLQQVVAARTQASGAKGAVRVDIQISPDIPLQITDVHAIASPDGLQSMDYRLVNVSQQRLLAAQISWTFRFADGSSLRSENRTEYFWNSGGMLGLGQFEQIEGSAIGGGKNAAPVQIVTGSISAAEFDNGTRLGPDAPKFFAWLDELRAGEQARYRELFNLYRSEGQKAFVDALQTLRPSETMAGKSARINLLDIYRQKGSAAAVAELMRLNSLQLPGH